MSREINLLFIALEQLKKILENAMEKANQASGLAAEISGDFEQELSTDLDDMSTSIEELLEALDTSIDEGKTLWEDESLLDHSLRAGLDDEENYKIDSEHIQEERKQDREERRR
jgi:division protein CdvB (Snf7/Vps24/ESCRT-III family)